MPIDNSNTPLSLVKQVGEKYLYGYRASYLSFSEKSWYDRAIMKKYIVVAILGVGLIVSPVALAAQFYSGEQVQLSGKDAQAGNTYIAGGNVDVSTPVNGDLFVAGGNVRVQSAVSGDLFVSGGDVSISGPVKGDVRAMGGRVTLASTVGGEVMLSGGNVEIASEANVGKVWVGAGQLIIAGTTDSIMAGTGQMIVSSEAHIKGALQYLSNNDVVVAQDAHIDGAVTRKIPPKYQREQERAPLIAAVVGGSLFWFLSGIIMLLLFVYLLPNKALFLSRDWKQNFATNLLWGVVVFIVTPVVVILLFISFIGIPLGLGLIAVYGISLYFAKLVAILAVGMWVKSLWLKDSSTLDWITVVFGFLIITLVGLIPVLGIIAIALAFLAGLGSVVRYDWSMVKKMRAAKDL